MNPLKRFDKKRKRKDKVKEKIYKQKIGHEKFLEDTKKKRRDEEKKNRPIIEKLNLIKPETINEEKEK